MHTLLQVALMSATDIKRSSSRRCIKKTVRVILDRPEEMKLMAKLPNS